MKLRDSMLYLTRGIIMGISSLIPGISVGSITFSLGAYENFITSIGTKRKRNAVCIVIIPIIIGLLAGIFGGVHIVTILLKKYKIQTIFFFIGILSGGYYLILKDRKIKPNGKNITIFVISLMVTLLLQVFISSFHITASNSYLNNFFTGLLSGIIFLLPGISTSSVLSFFNKYNYIIDSFKNIISITNIITIILFTIGAIISILIISKVIRHLLKMYKEKIYIIMFGLLTSSIIISLLEIDKISLKFSVIFPSILAFLWGYIFVKNFEKE